MSSKDEFNLLKSGELSRDSTNAFSLIVTQEEIDLLISLLHNDIDRKLRHDTDPSVAQSIFAKIIDLVLQSEGKENESD
jgi:hypothetical protein|tara:strand:- start:6723 stop:6959 length:237 start_codon:yes stop_codon:yes gene_type:complete